LVLAGIRGRWRPLRAELFPHLILLDFSDPQLLLGQSLKTGKSAPPVWQAPIPARTLRDGVPIAPDALGDFVGDLLLEHSSVIATLVVALPRPASAWRVVTWPGGVCPEDPIAFLRELNPDLRLPFSLRGASIDLQPLPGTPDRSLLVAAPKTTVEAWIDLFAIAGSRLCHLLPAQACQWMALHDQLEMVESGTQVGVLHPTSTNCVLDVWLDGVPVFERTLPLAAQELVPALRRSLAFCEAQFGRSCSRLLLTQPLQDPEAVEQGLRLQFEPVDLGGFGTLAMQGLAELDTVG
jgi:Tfp pilus assembly PilM family ATPase